ncbi:twin-arginine translocase subunit TatC [Pseudoxanthomonas sp. SGNA-20]|jgi:Twin arginine targeting (Tat) protein translocase TatC|uniref:Sec-independent protein translocase protein TatC n=1 Tax=Pseudoxanthomonas taiwanensis J19 TaxID=935569 RepID=A0A562D914_9GAMM|nr:MULTISPECIES: twin-arginine translocase subunit TatC [Pseudoxanthomonas]RRN53948.1 twin-arginine translocase subunit TatC [Pseudoxanthomonas sp. SGNA-20]RRN78807.1 twin-arginine translocase subunit TatC [Pseudoxanthomonas sp. SGD-10]TWH06095.1 sec-independent protein translocase protein TatC [Pseudoxanthomonas taiwanensis J19]
MDPATPETDSESPLMEHLLELRARIMRALAGLVVLLLALLPFANRLYAWLAAPLLQKLPEGGQLIAVEVASPFFAPLKLAFFAAVLGSAPWLLYQAWAFVAPGLYRREKRLALPLLVSSVLLFYAGCAFAFFVVLPSVFGFLAAVKPEGVAMMTDISAYLDFVLVIFLAFGASFELPVALVILVLLGWVTPDQLRAGRGYAIVGIFILAAVITPPDVVSQLLLAVPMCLLYEAGIWAARLLGRGEDGEADQA